MAIDLTIHASDQTLIPTAAKNKSPNLKKQLLNVNFLFKFKLFTFPQVEELGHFISNGKVVTPGTYSQDNVGNGQRVNPNPTSFEEVSLLPIERNDPWFIVPKNTEKIVKVDRNGSYVNLLLDLLLKIKNRYRPSKLPDFTLYSVYGVAQSMFPGDLYLQPEWKTLF